MIIVNEHGVVIGIVNENTVILKEEYIINKSEVIIGKSDSIRIVIEAEKEGDKIDGIYNKQAKMENYKSKCGNINK